MPGRYIINQTSGKRVVILEEDAEKIEGGYFDTEGVWHDLSGPVGGDLLGKYVINETGGKRIILLEEDADEIGGGYFDSDGTWMPFSSSSVITLKATDPGVGFGSFDVIKNTNTPPYISNQSLVRIHYLGADNHGVTVEAGKTYKFTFNVETCPDLYVGFRVFNQHAKDQVDALEAVTVTDTYDSGWVANTNGVITFTPPQVNGSDPVMLWFGAKKNAAGTVTFTGVDEIFDITVEEV